MGAPAATRREFCRRLFRLGGVNAAQRHSWLDELSDSAALQQDGGAVVSTSGNGASVSFQLPPNWSPDDAPALIDEARTWADAPSLDDALALIGSGVRCFRPDFTGLAR